MKGEVVIQSIDKTAAHFSKVKPEVRMSLMLRSDLHEKEECLVSPWLHEPMWRCFRLSDPGTFESLNFSHYRTPGPCKGITLYREIWFLVLGWQKHCDWRFGNSSQVLRGIVCPGGFNSRNRTE